MQLIVVIQAPCRTLRWRPVWQTYRRRSRQLDHIVAPSSSSNFTASSDNKCLFVEALTINADHVCPIFSHLSQSMQVEDKLRVATIGTVLPRDAMHKRHLCRHAVLVCVSVCLSVCLSRSWILWKRVIVSSLKI